MALINVANFFVAQPATNPPTGMGVDLGKTIAVRVGAPFEPALPSIRGRAGLADARSGKWDVAILGVDPARSADFGVQYAPVRAGAEHVSRSHSIEPDDHSGCGPQGRVKVVVARVARSTTTSLRFQPLAG